MRKNAIFTILFLLIGSVFAQNVNFSEASRVASQFFRTQDKSLVQCADVAVADADTLYYIFNADNGYVVVAGDRRVPPILAFSDQRPYTVSEMVPPAKMWMDNYRRQLAELKAQPASAQPVHEAWARLSRGEQPLRDVVEGMEPLVHSHWGQGTFYNYYCPVDFSGENDHVVTGCVATAMAQLIYYFRFPETGTGSYSYTDANYGVQSADYGATTYNYEAMCDEPTAINPEICKLMHHCGVGVDMVYGPDGSGMYNHSAARVLRTFFKYSPQTEYLFRDSTDLDWDSVIVSHLDRRIPMYYAGWSNPATNNGHGFLVDGYKIVDSAYYYHFNFGWDGYADNYFYTDQLNVSGTHFNLAQELIVNAYPDTTQYTYPTPQPLTGSKTLTALAGSFTDGSGEVENCHPDMDFIWNIVPDIDTLVSMTLDITYSLAEGDTLWIAPDCVNTFYALTADTGHWHESFPCMEIGMRLVTSNPSNSLGFRANYTTELPQYCRPVSIHSSASGDLSDGSGAHAYAPFTHCMYRIMPSGYNAILIDLHSLELTPGRDFLRIYKRPHSDNNLLAEFTGTLNDTTLVLEHGKVDIVFESDAQPCNGGFDLSYTGSTIGVVEHALQGLRSWPNPASTTLHLQSDELLREVEIFDLQGRKVWSRSIQDAQCDIPVADWTAGLYFVKARTSTETTTTKFIKQ